MAMPQYYYGQVQPNQEQVRSGQQVIPQQVQGGGVQPNYGQGSFYRQFQGAKRVGGYGSGGGGGGGGGGGINPQAARAQEIMYLNKQSMIAKTDQFHRDQQVRRDAMDHDRNMRNQQSATSLLSRVIGAVPGSRVPDEATVMSMLKQINGTGGSGGGPMNPANGATQGGPRPWGMRSDGTPMTTAERQMQTPTPEMQQQWRGENERFNRTMPAGMPQKEVDIESLVNTNDPEQKLKILEYMRNNFGDVKTLPLNEAKMGFTPRQAEAAMALKAFRRSQSDTNANQFAGQNLQQAIGTYGPPPTAQDRANADLYGAKPGHQAIDQANQFATQTARETRPNFSNDLPGKIPGMWPLSNQGLEDVRGFGARMNVSGGNRDVVDAAAMNRVGYDQAQQNKVNWLAGLSEDERMKLMQGQRPALPFTNPPSDPRVADYADAKQLYSNAQNYGSAQPLALPGGQTVQPKTIPGNDAGAKARMMAAQMAGQGMSPLAILQQAQTTGNQELAQLASAALENVGRYGTSTATVQPGASGVPSLDAVTSVLGAPGVGNVQPGARAGDVRPMPQPVAPQQTAQGPAPSGWNFNTVPQTGMGKMAEDQAGKNIGDIDLLRKMAEAEGPGTQAGSKMAEVLNGPGIAFGQQGMYDYTGATYNRTAEAVKSIAALDKMEPAQRYHASVALKGTKAYKDAKLFLDQAANTDGSMSADWVPPDGWKTQIGFAKALVSAVDRAAMLPEGVAAAQLRQKEAEAIAGAGAKKP